MTGLHEFIDASDVFSYSRPHERGSGRQGPWSSGVPSTAAFAISGDPAWLPTVQERIRQLVGLPEGWDGHDGKPVKIDVARFALRLLRETLDPLGPAPQLVPLSYGGLQLEWHENGIDLEIEVEAANRIFVSFEDHSTGEQLEKEMSTDYREVSQIMRRLAAGCRR